MKKFERSNKRAVSNRVSAPAVETSSENSDTGDNLTLDEIKELVEIVHDKQFTEFELVRGGFRLRLQRGADRISAAENRHPVNVPSVMVESRPVEPSPTAVPPAGSPAPAQEEEKLHIITSPIVGTFYRSSSPASDPFIKLGDLVEAEQTLCIIEAMKLMNEIKSDSRGTIAKIFVENGQPVEYGQALFGIKE